MEKSLTSPVYIALRYSLNLICFNTFGVGFMLLSLEANYKFYKNLYFSINILNIVIFAFFMITGFG